ncbi:hypothetical protein FRC01_000727 [Tulasnella sp. 417]|nr:hypothetical protein FRC01_000727 [Tulasnella sp. 417]
MEYPPRQSGESPSSAQLLAYPNPPPNSKSTVTKRIRRGLASIWNVPAKRFYPLQFTLEELFKGGRNYYRVTSRMLSGEPRIQDVEIAVEPGWAAGTRIIFNEAGDECAPGVFQTLVFVVDQTYHERFTRRKAGELVFNQNIDPREVSAKNGGRALGKVVGLDGKVIDVKPEGVIYHGQETVIRGEGMLKRKKGKVVGRGDLIIR